MFKVPFKIACYNFAGYTACYYGSVRTNYVKWDTCREMFFQSYKTSDYRRGFYVALPNRPNGGPSKEFAHLEKLLTDLQDKMGLNPKWRLRIMETDRKDARFIRISTFWSRIYRLDFLTAFIRTAKNLKLKTLDEVFARGKYLKHTRPAINRFISGHRKMPDHMVLNFNGWMDFFRKKDDKAVEALLV